jgi:HSP20 family protein
MNIVRWEPMRELDEFFRRYAPAHSRGMAAGKNGEEVSWTPAANISETNREYLIKAELPEMKKEDVKITLQNGVITIAGERKHVKEDKDENTLRIESFYGTFSRSFSLPDGIDSAAIKAESKDGILSVHIPKTQAVMPSKIDIKVQ